MNKVGDFFAGPIGSVVRVFLAAVVGAFAAYQANGGTLRGIGFDDLEAWVGLGIAAILPVVLAALNPSDPRFGNVSDVPDPVSPPTNA
jgi:hypothetical protein